MGQHTEADLDILIEDKLDNCDSAYKNICLFKQTDEGRSRIKTRIKELIFNDGIDNVDSALAMVDNQLDEEKLQD